jgi:hypothetical protein
MSKTLDWIKNNPSAFASLIAAVMAASVALFVFAVTQFLTARKERTQFLTPKLEALYLLLNKVAEDNTRFFKMICLCLGGSSQAKKDLASTDEQELYGHKTAKEIIMYIRLYFPQLSRIHQLLFSAQRELNDLIFRLHTETPPDQTAILLASGRVGHFLRLTEEEIIRNRDHLLENHWFPKRYKRTSQAAIETEIPPPDGPIFNSLAE